MGTKIKYRFVRILLVLTASLTFTNLFSQDTQVRPSRQAALDAFSKGDYEVAYREFSILLDNYTHDPLYKYYSGVCLVNLSREPGRAMTLLQEGVSSPQEIKSIPADAWFYLGRSQQMSGRFAEAIKSFNHFASISGKRTARSFNVEQFLQECNEGKGQVKEERNVMAETTGTKAASVAAESHQAIVEKAEKQAVNKPQAQREVLPEKYDKMLAEGMGYQIKADSLNGLAAGYRKVYGQLPASQRAPYKKKITETDSLAAFYQKLADQKLGTGKQETSTNRDIIVPETTSRQVKPVTPVASQKVGIDPGKAPVSQKTQEVFYLFEVIKDAKLIQEQKIEIDPSLPAGLIYRIQMGVFSKPVTPSFFKGLSPVSGFRVPSSGMIRYFAGMFRKSTDANKALQAVKQLGFKDSFIVVISNGSPVSLDRAAVLEKEWGSIPLKKIITESGAGTSIDTGPPTLSFRVEVTRSVKPLKEEVADTYRKLAGNRGYEILSTEDGSTVYLIGKFITFESASEYADLLNRNGYREAKVVAYLGNKEIPVETAKELFGKVE